jgi:hypothetical protein
MAYVLLPRMLLAAYVHAEVCCALVKSTRSDGLIQRTTTIPAYLITLRNAAVDVCKATIALQQDELETNDILLSIYHMCLSRACVIGRHDVDVGGCCRCMSADA